MARNVRVQYPGAIYHVMNRGDHSEAVFRDRQDSDLFSLRLGEASAKTDWQVHSYCLKAQSCPAGTLLIKTSSR
jgi:putative transposase